MGTRLGSNMRYGQDKKGLEYALMRINRTPEKCYSNDRAGVGSSNPMKNSRKGKTLQISSPTHSHFPTRGHRIQITFAANNIIPTSVEFSKSSSAISVLLFATSTSRKYLLPLSKCKGLKLLLLLAIQYSRPCVSGLPQCPRGLTSDSF